ncbi:MAG: hypothetical protein L3J71_07395 [Victivallaceae bacterium]|nr:hypothetical protein [Victivallaceae bacterium]
MKVLSEQEYQQLLEITETIERDKQGEKVLEYPDGRYMKLFRIKKLISSARLYPYWRRFIRNTATLKRLNIPTIASIEEVVRVPHIKKTAIIYKPLLGRTIIQLQKKGELTEDLIVNIGAFVASLHAKGVYFRSLHLGNVVLDPDGQLGLIDISDLQTSPFALSVFSRKRNLRYLFRCWNGLRLLNNPQHDAQIFINEYLRNLKPACATRMKTFLSQLREELAQKE